MLNYITTLINTDMSIDTSQLGTGRNTRYICVTGQDGSGKTSLVNLISRLYDVNEGSVVVLGDVNAGAEIIAEDNIVILGNLRGLAHAGAKGNKKAVIAANMIDCPQIRIANIIKEKETLDENEIAGIKNYAYVDENDNLILE